MLFGFVTVVIFINISETEKELERRLDYSLNLSTTSLPKALWNLDNDVVEDFVAALFLDEAIAHVKVMWGKQVISEQTRKNFQGTDFSDPNRSSSLIIKASEISVENQKLGTIRIAMSRESVRKKLVFNITGIVTLTTLIILGISWTSIVITKRYISRPLSQLQASATSIAHGNLEALIEINGRDEIGTLARDLNVMRESIKELFEEIRESNEKLEEYGRTLEQRVEERTVELAEKSNTLEQLSNQLAKYLSPQIYDSIFLNNQEVKIASSRKKLTVFFSDIADFTETADRLQSEELTELLNHYLTEMSEIALEYGATIDKYVGDTIVIFFGDPESKGVKEDALACVKMSIAMRWRMNELQQVWRDSGIEKPLHCRMGIHTDYCTVGNFGSETRMDYTIIVGGVNLASRLETAATPGEILISYETFAHVNDLVACEKHGELEVRESLIPLLHIVWLISMLISMKSINPSAPNYPILKSTLTLIQCRRRSGTKLQLLCKRRRTAY